MLSDDIGLFLTYKFNIGLGFEEFIHLATVAPTIPDLLTLWTIVRHITSGLEFIHSINEIHRDVKPKNGIHLHL